MADRRRAAIVGGGITGLAAAYEFTRSGWDVDVFEASERWGGKILSSPVGEGTIAPRVDAGPDAILARAESAVGLVRELGLEDEMTHPIAPKPAYLFFDGKLHLLPAGTVLGVPVDPATLDDTELISPDGKQRVASEPTLPPMEVDGGTTIGELCRARLGDELTDRLIDPLVGGINASNIDHLSAEAAAPILVQAMKDYGSLIRGLAAMYPQLGGHPRRFPSIGFFGWCGQTSAGVLQFRDRDRPADRTSRGGSQWCGRPRRFTRFTRYGAAPPQHPDQIADRRPRLRGRRRSARRPGSRVV